MGDSRLDRVGLTNVWVLLAISLSATLGCSSSGSAPSNGGAGNCGTQASPVIFTLKDVTPAAGSSVPNSNIVMTFTVVGLKLQIDPQFVLLPALHTAGVPIPNPIPWTLSLSGNDTVYTSMAFSWTAPGHVEMDPEFVEQDPSTSCIYELPTPTFSYDVTAP